jgi:broad specificity phosphatase PhoE
VTGAFGDIIAAHGDQTVAVVTHGGVLGSILRWLLGMPRVRPGPTKCFALLSTPRTNFFAGDFFATSLHF